MPTKMKSVLKPFYEEGMLEAGCDEAGRGCLAGPVTAAAVILAPDFEHPLLNDSKKLTAAQRDTLRPVIEVNAISYGVAFVDHKEIDKVNILNASFLAMHRAVEKLRQLPELLLIDGNRFKKYKEVRHHCIVKGDQKYRSIAAASILAKTYRDAYMKELHEEFPHYHWEQNKGYPTQKHREAIARFGASKYHRKSFALLPKQMKLDI